MTPQSLPSNEAPPSASTKKASTFFASSPRFLIIGAGARGTAYARAITTSTPGSIFSIADPIVFKRRVLGSKYAWSANPSGKAGKGQEFGDWKEWIEWEKQYREKGGRDGTGKGSVDGVCVCTLDETHREIVTAIAQAFPSDERGRGGLHILCEKPIALSMSDCVDIYRSLSPSKGVLPTRIFSIGHVLRYSPYSLLLRKLLYTDKAIGDVVSIEHTEPVGHWHFSHSYVRGNWRRESPEGVGSLLAKSCHDIDFVLWLLATPPQNEGERDEIDDRRRVHLPSTIASTGHLSTFRRSRKPRAAGTATNCLSCNAEKDCVYSALRIYRDRHLRKMKTGWPVHIVCPEIEDFCVSEKELPRAEDMLMEKLSEDWTYGVTKDEEVKSRAWYGRCVYEADNDVCDDQVVTIGWNDEAEEGSEWKIAKTASIHMIAQTQAQCHRRGRIYGTHGEIAYDDFTGDITVYDFRKRFRDTDIEADGEEYEDGTVTVHAAPKQPEEEKVAHGGGDYGLARQFVAAVMRVMEEEERLDRSSSGTVVGEQREVLADVAAKAQRRVIGCTVEDALLSHAVVFAAEEARREEKVVKWRDWWEKEMTI